MVNIYINKKEREAIYMAEDYIRNLIEGCPAGEDSTALKDLRKTFGGLHSLGNKVLRNL